MKSKCLVYAIVLAAISITMASGASAATRYKVLHSFSDRNGEGYAPEAVVVMDSAGNLYGTTVAGGNGGVGCGYPGCGIVFQLKPNPDGSWSELIVHNFTGYDGRNSYAPVTLDSRGNLYGTTKMGSTGGNGTVFKLSPAMNGSWTAFALESFSGGLEGGQSYAGVMLDSSGHLYGTTSVGGADNVGVVFGLGQSKPGSAVLHSFGSVGDGNQSYGPLISDAGGNLYGTTWSGGTYDAGSVFKMTRDPLSGTWSETVLYSFRGVPYGGGADGANPYAGVVFDAAGNLYGTTFYGGAASAGTAFKLSPNSDGTWSETLLHTFTGQNDGGSPYGGLTLDQSGNVYGTTASGGPGGYGTIFRMRQMPTGQWQETVVYGFNGGVDGAWPGAGVVLDGAGNLYGTAAAGGVNGLEHGGVVFEITP
jgi:uncharacterized repeat protein (TIGR03803 family)